MRNDLSHAFIYEDDPDRPGWKLWRLADAERFNDVLGPLSVRVEDGVARVMMQPRKRLSNLSDKVHGGALLAFIDVALFAAGRGLGALTAGAGVTLELSTSFIGTANLDEPVEARVELLKETGRLMFERGVIVQGEETIASFNATLRKFKAPAA